MDLQKIIGAAREISDRTGGITFEQLNELCPAKLEHEDVKALLKALTAEGIHLIDDKP
jgi:hypothetical protein